MATNSDSPANDVDENYMSMSLHEMFHIVGDQMTENDIKFLKFFCAGLISEEMTSMVNDGFSFLLCMEKMNLVSESNFMNVLDLLRIINRHDLSQYVHLRCRKTVRRDPICEYLESNFSHQQSRVTPDNTEVIDDREKKSDKSLCGVVGGSDECCDHEDTTVSQHNNKPRSYRPISDTPGSVHSQSSDSNCQTSPVTSSTLTSVCSSSSPSSSSKICAQKSLSIDVPAMSTRSKRQRSGDSADGSGASCDNTPSPCHKRRRKDTERNTVKAHGSSTDVSHRGSGSNIDVSADSAVQERVPSDMNSSNTQEESRTPPEEGKTPSEEDRTLPEEGSSDTVQPDCTDSSSHDGDQTNFSSKSSNSSESGTDSKKETVTCDIRLRVRAEVSLQESTLEGNVFSNKPTVVERQCEKFMQASTVLKSHDLGSIVCDIKFSDLTYLDAFWRDYINGSLLEALKGVFLTESLKQTVGHEAIKLLVNVDEDDYEAGRIKLLQNMKN